MSKCSNESPIRLNESIESISNLDLFLFSDDSQETQTKTAPKAAAKKTGAKSSNESSSESTASFYGKGKGRGKKSKPAEGGEGPAAKKSKKWGEGRKC